MYTSVEVYLRIKIHILHDMHYSQDLIIGITLQVHYICIVNPTIVTNNVISAYN